MLILPTSEHQRRQLPYSIDPPFREPASEGYSHRLASRWGRGSSLLAAPGSREGAVRIKVDPSRIRGGGPVGVSGSRGRRGPWYDQQPKRGRVRINGAGSAPSKISA